LRSVWLAINLNASHIVLASYNLVRHHAGGAVNFWVGNFSTHQPFDRKNGVFRVKNHLTLGNVADQIFDWFDNRRGSVAASI
jgi:hypothetical protein